MKRISSLVNKATASRFESLAGMIVALLFFMTVLALSPNSANAQCSQWNVSGDWVIVQRERYVTFSITQKGNIVTGKALSYLQIRKNSDPKYHGDVDGTVKGDDFVVHVYWDNNVIGVYTGKISLTGKLEGKTYDQANPSSKIPWYSDKSFVCPAPPPIPKVFKTTGHPKVDPPPPPAKTVKTTGRPAAAPVANDNAAAPAPMKVPGIIASLNNATIPAGKSSGKTTITWNGGRAHPYAEVWVKVDDQDETKVIEAGKGSLEATIVPGKTYVYILTDAGKTLDTVTVKFHR
jgi:hypothetical protein